MGIKGLLISTTSILFHLLFAIYKKFHDLTISVGLLKVPHQKVVNKEDACNGNKGFDTSTTSIALLLHVIYI
jgi:hypothetical protein